MRITPIGKFFRFKVRKMVDEGNTLLASLGRLGRDFANLLIDRAELSGGELNLYQPAEGETLLAMVQNDILNLRQAEAGERILLRDRGRHGLGGRGGGR